MYVLSQPAIYALELTPQCNNRCPGCSNVYAGHRSQLAPMPARDWHELLAPLLPEAVQVSLTGGEPTLHPEFDAILDDVTSYGVRVTVFTNARWRRPHALVSQLAAQPNLAGLLISLHGANQTSHEAFTRVPGSFAEALCNIALAISHGIPVALSTVITRHSWNQLEDVVALGRDLGVDHIAVNRYIGAPVPSLSASPAQMRTAIKTVQALARAGEPIGFGIGVPQCFILNQSEGCLAGVAYAAIDPSGRLRPCAHSPTIVGSLLERSMGELWHGETMQAWRARVPDACVDCAAYSVCHGGCRAMQELHPKGRDPLRQGSLDEFEPYVEPCELVEAERPRIVARIREESFGYVLLGQGRVVAVSPEARPLIEACDGHSSFAELAGLYGQPGLDLLGELRASGMLEV